MKEKSRRNPRPVMLSKRANVFYLEHVRVLQMDDRLVFATQDEGELERFFNLPERNTAFILLGKGSSITDAAARRLAGANVMVGFCGSGGSPLFSALDMAFLAPQSEYRPTEYMQQWMRLWLDDAARLRLGRLLLYERARYAERQWQREAGLQAAGVAFPLALRDTLLAAVDKAASTQELLLAEAVGPRAFMPCCPKHSNFLLVERRVKTAAPPRPTCAMAFWTMATILLTAMLLWLCVGSA